MNEQLIAYLKAQLAPKETILLDYQAAINEADKIRAALAIAEEKVNAFGNIAKIESEVSELQGFINSLTIKAAPAVAEVKVEAVAPVMAAPTVQPAAVAVDCAKPAQIAPQNQIII